MLSGFSQPIRSEAQKSGEAGKRHSLAAAEANAVTDTVRIARAKARLGIVTQPGASLIDFRAEESVCGEGIAERKPLARWLEAVRWAFRQVASIMIVLSSADSAWQIMIRVKSANRLPRLKRSQSALSGNSADAHPDNTSHCNLLI